jgi:hypothetical protein
MIHDVASYVDSASTASGEDTLHIDLLAAAAVAVAVVVAVDDCVSRSNATAFCS